MKIEKIISGGQTGADQGGLEAAESLGIPTGGFMPKGFRTEDGPRPDLAERFGLLEHSAWGYPPRTRTNVRTSDLTICFGSILSAGSKLTKRHCETEKMPFIHIPYTRNEILVNKAIAFAVVALSDVKPCIINIAGNRESKNLGIQEFTKNTLIEILEQYMKG